MAQPEPSVALGPYGYDERVATLHRSAPSAGLPLGRVARVDYDRAQVVTGAATRPARSDPLPAVGDWVTLTDPAHPGAPPGADTIGPVLVAEVLPRWSQLVRQAARARTEPQVVAANVDLVLCVHGLDRDVRLNRVEREQVLAWEAGARPVLVLAKADLADDADGSRHELERRVPGAEVVVTSVATGEGLADLAALLRPSRTAVLFGASGVGKSTLVNALVGADVQRVGEVRDADRRGRHTTSARQLVPVPGGGVLLDTPGVRSLGLWMSGHGIERAFADVEELARACRFSDCGHDGEPGCEVAAAVDEGRLDPARLASWRKLRAEEAALERRVDALARAEERRRWKAIQKALRGLPRKR